MFSQSIIGYYFRQVSRPDPTRDDLNVSSSQGTFSTPIMKAPSRFLEAAIALAVQAGEKILALYRTAFRVGHRPDGSPFTAADLVSHHFLSERLPGLDSGFPVLSGQSPPPFSERGGWETYWLLAPLTEADAFISHSGEFAVNIALIHQNKPVLGVVYAPATQTCYFAAEGCGAFKQIGAGEPETIHVRMQAPARPCVVGGEQDSLDAYLRELGAHDFERLGNALAFCRVAEGTADLHPGLAPSAEWETAAAQCIVEAAGGAVTDLKGRPLRYNARPSLSNPYFLSFGDTRRDWRGPAAGIEEPAMPHPHADPSPLLKAAIDLAYKAGGKILAVYRTDFRVGHKEDASPLTAADLAAHHCLAEGLQALPGGYPVISEEAAILPFEERRDWDSYWLIDPLDGTKEFVKRNGEFTVNIALIRGHKPVLGVVYAPALDLCYFAEEGGGAFKQNGTGEARPIAVRGQAPRRPAVAGSRSHALPAVAQYLERLGGHELKPVGSSLKFCLVAEGAADLYPRLGPTCEWDTAAAQCVVEAAGGAVTDLSGRPLAYNTKPSLLNPYFLVFGDSATDWKRHAEGLEPTSEAVAG
jgi:3'(2'), 5'-bisphosphate nucleotidase